MSLDIIIPIYNESENLESLVNQIKNDLLNYFKEICIILIDDGSTDNTINTIKKIIFNENKINIKYFHFIRNYGKEIAVKCGLDQSTGDYSAIMDGDLQHPPKYLIGAHKKIIETDSIIIYITPQKRVKNLYHKIGTFGYKRLLNMFSKNKVYLTDFTLLKKKAVDFIQLFNESDFYTRGILSLTGLKSSEINYIPVERKFGSTKFSFTQSFNLAIKGVISVSTQPLRIAIYLGSMFSGLSILFGIFLLIEKILFGQPIEGFATLGFGLFFLGGIQLLFLGVIGEYIGKIFIQSKKRPLYKIDLTLKK